MGCSPYGEQIWDELLSFFPGERLQDIWVGQLVLKNGTEFSLVINPSHETGAASVLSTVEGQSTR
jgi:hypothetical protein